MTIQESANKSIVEQVTSWKPPTDEIMEWTVWLSCCEAFPDGYSRTFVHKKSAVKFEDFCKSLGLKTHIYLN